MAHVQHAMLSWMFLESKVLIAICVGFLSHWYWFVRGEHDNYAGNYVRYYLVAFTVLVLTHLNELPLLQSLAASTIIAVSNLSALTVSILTYRLVLSPIRHIPGPFLLKCSKIYHFWNIRALDNFRFLNKLHQKYGNVVRTGPNEVTFFTSEGFRKVYGPESRCIKAIYYDAPRPLTSLVNERDTRLHGQWRRVWEQAFSTKALKTYEPVIYSYASQLINLIKSEEGHTINVAAYFEYYTFDILGKLGLDCEFRLLQRQPCRALELYHAGAKVLGPIVSIPWFIHATSVIPGLRKGYWEQNRWICSELSKKRSAKPEKKAIIDHIIRDAHENGGFDAHWNRLQGDWLITMAAGTDPMNKCLTNMMYYLAAEPQHLPRIHAELSTVTDLSDNCQLQHLTHFEAFILETLRLNPAIPAAGTRVVPAEGFEVDGVFVPGGTIALVPHHTVFRRADCFVQPESFIPERFTTRPELVLNKSALQPWSAGRFSCVGKQLGLMEIRIAAAMVILNLDFEFAPDDDGKEMFERTTDHFTSLPGPLRLAFKRRDEELEVARMTATQC